MNVLIINQPTDNRGDEAAHRSFIRAIIKRYPFAKITIIFCGISEDSIKQMGVFHPNIEYINIPFRRGNTKIPRFAITYKCEKLIGYLHPQLCKILKYIKNNDLVITAPGGICMGLFQNWSHIYWIRLAQIYNKSTAYYSRSFGPFLENTKHEKIFKSTSLFLLKNMNFISIRDKMTMDIADEINLSYIPSIDTAFLDTPDVNKLPHELINLIESKDYIIFVPNSLTWHPAYKSVDRSDIDNFYFSIIELLSNKYPDFNIIMLPQLFNTKTNGDWEYFEDLKKRFNFNSLIVISDKYSSDIQQKIIAGAKFVIGARYHSIVFAINNNVPFISLSYEHKMNGLLGILNKTEQGIDISLFKTNSFDIQKNMIKIEHLLDTIQPDYQAKDKARSIALNCFNLFCVKYIEK